MYRKIFLVFIELFKVIKLRFMNSKEKTQLSTEKKFIEKSRNSYDLRNRDWKNRISYYRNFFNLTTFELLQFGTRIESLSDMGSSKKDDLKTHQPLQETVSGNYCL
ncbi:hypothetical protein LEP1GSC043_4553 [Leptospira weilii str. Ecochallenge]|uniref:Uncharacterized protein n=1 Tax=Leptospira weilii str. Ecochallenge TaxID=1049986 RepID=N1TWZ6_9LEPT|nr:hypothetical protein LEP1GSC043_4553 [Leptospira weilii str. Ecochallenge]